VKKREGNTRGKKEKRADLKEGTGRACSVCNVWKENQLEEEGRGVQENMFQILT